jgi:hypothetical protein
MYLEVHPAPLDFRAGCGYLQVRDPHRLAQAYDKAISALDRTGNRPAGPPDTLAAIAQRHMLTNRAINPFEFRWRVGRFGRLPGRLRRAARSSPVDADHATRLQTMRHEADATRP